MKQLKSIAKSLNDFQKILILFLVWRVVLFVIAYLATIFIPTWGGWYPYVERSLEITGLPSWIWGFGGFDGVHYLRIAQNGYVTGSQAFFPMYPVVINLLSRIIPVANYYDPQFFVNTNFFYAGMIISNLIFIPALWVVKKLFDTYTESRYSWLAIILLLVFPTSFFFGAIYTESIFLFFAASTLYFYKKGNYFLAGLFGILTSATKIVGIAIPGIMIIDALIGLWKREMKGKNWRTLFSGIVGSLGLFSYMAYLQVKFGDALLFLNSQPMFGAGRSAEPVITLPQVFYRYFKILSSIPFTEMRFYNALFELLLTIVILVVLLVSVKKIKFSYWLATLAMIIVPTLTGTFSSMPRYILVAFLLFPFIASRLKKAYTPVAIALGILGVICIALFTKGYWVA
mgnify:FL=1